MWVAASGATRKTTRSSLGTVRLEVTLVALQHHLLSRAPRRETERPAGDQVVAKPIAALPPFGEGDLAPDVLRQDLAFDGIEKLGGVGLAEAKADGVRVDDLDVGDGVLEIGVAPGDLRGDLRLPGPAHILGGDRHAVAPHRVLAQVERQRAMVVRPVVGARELGRERRRMVGEVGLLGKQLHEELIEQVGGELDVACEQLVDARKVGDRRPDGSGCPARLRRRRRPVAGAAEGEPAGRSGEETGTPPSRATAAARRDPGTMESGS